MKDGTVRGFAGVGTVRRKSMSAISRRLRPGGPASCTELAQATGSIAARSTAS